MRHKNFPIKAATVPRKNAFGPYQKLQGVNSMQPMQICTVGEHSREKTRKKLLNLFLAVSFAFIVAGGRLAAAQTFQHPGVLVSRAQLDFVKQQVANKADPIYS